MGVGFVFVDEITQGEEKGTEAGALWNPLRELGWGTKDEAHPLKEQLERRVPEAKGEWLVVVKAADRIKKDEDGVLVLSFGIKKGIRIFDESCFPRV